MSRNRFFFLAQASAFAILIGLAAGSARAETLSDAVDSALTNHPSIEAATANRDAYHQESWEHWSDYFPQISLRAGVGRGYLDNSTSRGLVTTRGAAYTDLWEGSATLTQPLFDGFGTPNRVAAAEARESSAGYSLMDAQENIALRASIAYLDVLRMRESIADIRDYTKSIDDYIVRIGKMVKEGAADKSVIAQARDIRDQLASTLNDMEGQAGAAEATYAEITGHRPDDLVKPQLVTDQLPPKLDDRTVEALKESHPLLQSAVWTQAALEHDAEADRQFLYPDVTGELSYRENDQREEVGGEAVDERAMLRASWDLSLGGGQLAKMRKGAYRSAEGRAKRADTARQIEKNIRASFSNLETAEKQLAVLQDRMKINQDLFGNAKAQFNGAKINLLQLLQADNALFNAKLSLTGGQYKLRAAQYSALASAGMLEKALQARDLAEAMPVPARAIPVSAPAPAPQKNSTLTPADNTAAPAPKLAPAPVPEPVTPETVAPQAGDEDMGYDAGSVKAPSVSARLAPARKLRSEAVTIPPAVKILPSGSRQ
jgi:adhesin transport system outer membrane protein